MKTGLSPNTQAILLLTAPLLVGRGRSTAEPLSPGEYRKLAGRLRELQRQPADLLASGGSDLLEDCRLDLASERLEQLLGRGFLLSQAVEHWRARAIWVLSRADPDYPRRLKKCLGESAPAVLYGCGDATILDAGGLAVVGSRNVDEALVEYTEAIGRLTAMAGRTLVSGGARGIDQAAMRGALQAGGRAAGVLADGLEKAAMNREHRKLLLDQQLVLISPYDPAARFHVGHAMQRNKVIYALSDAALAVSSDYQKGGTWTGATEQLEKLGLVPVYVRASGDTGPGLDGLRQRGAIPWPEPANAEALAELLDERSAKAPGEPPQGRLPLAVRDAAAAEKRDTCDEEPMRQPGSPPERVPDESPREELLSKVREILGRTNEPRTEADIAEDLGVSKGQARDWLKRLVEEGTLEKLSGPVRYRSRAARGSLFDG